MPPQPVTDSLRSSFELWRRVVVCGLRLGASKRVWWGFGGGLSNHGCDDSSASSPRSFRTGCSRTAGSRWPGWPRAEKTRLSGGARGRARREEVVGTDRAGPLATRYRCSVRHCRESSCSSVRRSTPVAITRMHGRRHAANSPTIWERWWGGSAAPDLRGPANHLAVAPAHAKAAQPDAGQRGLCVFDVGVAVQLLGLSSSSERFIFFGSGSPINSSTVAAMLAMPPPLRRRTGVSSITMQGTG